MTTPPPPDALGEKPKDCNDNSNPQQGTGGNRLRASPPVAYPGPRPVASLPYSRPSLKIPPTQKDERKLFVGGLPSNVTSEEFRVFFEGFGPVMDSIVLVDKTTNRSRGFGFVTFEEGGTARTLLSMGNGTGRLEMQGKMIEVKAAQPKESTRRPPGNSYDSGTMHGQQPIKQPVSTMAVNQAALPPPAYGQQPYYQAPPGHPVFAGYMAPMYYHMPPPQEMLPVPDVVPPTFHQQTPVMMEAAAAYAFVPAAPFYGVAPPGVMSPPQGLAPVVPPDYYNNMMNPMDDGNMVNEEM